MKRLIFLGPPGAGKGTQAKSLANLLSVPHISTGEILRSAIASQTALGQESQVYVEHGKLVPDELLNGLVRDRLQQSDAQAGWILDGFPRTLSQASFLEGLLAERHQGFDYAIDLEVPDAVLVSRLLERGRQDDSEQTIYKRLEVYRTETAPVLGFYRDRSSLKVINGDRSMAEVTESLTQLVAPSDPLNKPQTS